MNIEQALQRVADTYTNQGYQVVLRPKPEELPAFAKDFTVEIVGRRGIEGVLVVVKRNTDEVAADTNLPRYAEVVGSHSPWRLDVAVLEAEGPMGRGLRGREDFSGEEIGKALAEAEQVARMGFVRPAVITAWAAMEAAMRMRLRAAGEKAGWGTMPRVLLNELYSSGILSMHEFRELERLAQFRYEIAHGFSSAGIDPDAVSFLSKIARRLLEEARSAAQVA